MVEGTAIAGGSGALPALPTWAMAPVLPTNPPTAAPTDVPASLPSNPLAPGDPLRELMEIETSVFGTPARPGVIGAVDQYEILELIGRGGMGAVYLAVDTITSARVAVKVLAGKFSRHPAAVGRFLEEASRMARLSHRSILPVLSVSPDLDNPYYVMRYIE